MAVLFGHYDLLLFPYFLSFPGKGQHMFLSVYWVILFFGGRCSGSIHIWVKYAKKQPAISVI